MNSPRLYPFSGKGSAMSTDSNVRSGTRDVRPRSGIDAYFQISERGSTVEREIRGGFATFFTMAYIVVLNPLIIGSAQDANGQRLDLGALATSTALVACVMTVLMGVVGRYPFAIAAGLGLNAVVAFQLAAQMSWPAAMGIVVIEGLVITLLVLTGLRQWVMEAIPLALKQSISVGIGLFIAFIGFVDAGFVRRIPDVANTPVPVQLGVGNRLIGWPTVVFVFGLLLTILLVARRVRGAILLGIVITAAFAIVLNWIVDVGPRVDAAGNVNPSGWGLTVPSFPDSLVSSPDFSLLGAFSLGGSFAQVGVVLAVLFVFTLMLSDFFDTMGTVIGVANEGGLLDQEGRLPGVGRVLLVDSVAAAAGGAASCSSNTTYVESAAGVGDGARTGLASVVIGLLFLITMFLSPLIEVVPQEAATPALVVVGFLLMRQVADIAWDDPEIAIPAFLTIVLMPFTFSITNGIGAGFIAYVAIKAVRGRWREPGLLLWIIALAFVVYFAIDPVERLLGVR
jgi:AGZA family xanthine/uracil permease-like MFS transporter